METLWRIELLGDLRVIRADRVLTRFRSRKAAALLAYLAFYRDRAHPRDRLTDLLWPDESRESARSKLWTALSSLRRQLEPPGTPAGTVILATRLNVRLDPAAVTTDMAAFETALAAAARARGVDEQARRLDEAIALSRGPLLPGYYEAWILPEQQRLSEQFSQALRQTIGRLEQTGQLERALGYAGRAVAIDPLREEAHHDLIRLYAAAGQITAARRQYREWERLLREELHEEPSAALRELMQRLDRGELPALPSGHSPLPTPAGLADQSRAVSSTLAPPAPRPPELGDEARGYLPPTLTRFFGREPEIARLRKLLLAEGVRLVTLTGPGGSGKTRLALEAAARLRDALDGAVWFVPLVDLSDPAEQVPAGLRGPDQTAWMDRLEAERDNFRAALDWSVSSGAVAAGLQVAVALRTFWIWRGYFAEGRQRLAQLLERAEGVPDLLLARGLHAAGFLAHVALDFTAARPLQERAMRLSECIGDRLGVARALQALALMEFWQHHFAAARALQEQCVPMVREIGTPEEISTLQGSLGLTAACQGDHDAALIYQTAALAFCRERGDRVGAAVNLNNLGISLLAQGDAAAARAHFAESLAIKWEIVGPRGLVWSLAGLAEVAAVQGQPERAARLFGAAEAGRGSVGRGRPPSQDAVVRSLRELLGPDRFDAAWAEGQAMSTEQAVEEARRET